MADKFKTGDVVRRKAGGPRMTVVSYGEYQGKRKCLCRWSDNRGEPKCPRDRIKPTSAGSKPEMVDAGLYGGGYGTEGGNLAVVQRRIAWRSSDAFLEGELDQKGSFELPMSE